MIVKSTGAPPICLSRRPDPWEFVGPGTVTLENLEISERMGFIFASIDHFSYDTPLRFKIIEISTMNTISPTSNIPSTPPPPSVGMLWVIVLW